MTVEVGGLGVAAEERVRAIAAARRGEMGPLLPILHEVQDEFGYVDASVVPVLADALNLSVAEVHGVVTFYRDFRRAPGGRVAVKVCRAEACQSVGANELVAHAEAGLGTAVGGTTADGAFSLDEVFCLGNCALGPAVQVGGKLYGRVGPARLDALLGQAR